MATDPTTIPSIGDLQKTKKYMDDIDNFVSSENNSFTDTDGVNRKTMEGLTSDVDTLLDRTTGVGRDNAWGIAQDGIDNTVDGDYFSVVSPSENGYLDLYKNESNVAEFKKQYPSSELVKKTQRPNGVGMRNMWPDTFFTLASKGGNYLGLKRIDDLPTLSIVDNDFFEGKAVAKTGAGGGFYIYASEGGFSEGDTVTVSALVTGSDIDVTMWARCRTEGNVNTGNQFFGALTRVNNNETTLIQAEVTIDTGASIVYAYPLSQGSEYPEFKIQSLWVTAGGLIDAPIWPFLYDQISEFNEADTERREADTERRVSDLEGNELDAKSKLDYMVESQTVVTSDSETVVESLSSFAVDKAFGVPFSGWGSRIVTPSSIEFNAVRIKALSRKDDVPQADYWRTLKVIVRTGEVDSHQGETIAYGEALISPESSEVYDITVILRDLNTGAPTTVNRTDLSDEYFIAAYVTNSNGGRASMSVVAGSYENLTTIGNGLYTIHPELAPDAVGFTPASGSNKRESVFEHLLLVNPVEAFKYEPTKEFTDDILTRGYSAPEILSWIPPKIYALQNFDTAVYFRNLISTEHENYYWDIQGTAIGSQQSERWWILSPNIVSGDAMSISIHNKINGEQLEVLNSSLTVSPENSKSALTTTALVIGDSLVAAGIITSTLLSNASSDVMNLDLIGTKGAGDNKHEGRGGWSIPDYAGQGRTDWKFTVSGITEEPAINSTKYTNNGVEFTVQEVSLINGSGFIICSAPSGSPSTSGVLTKSNQSAGDSSISFTLSEPLSQNPFWINGEIDFAAYLSTNSLATPDIVFISLGINDIFGQVDDSGAYMLSVERLGMLKDFIDSILLVGGVKVGVIPIAGPSSSQDSFGYNYQNNQTQWRFKRNAIIWNKELVSLFSDMESSGVFIVPSGLNYDTVNNSSRASEAPVNFRSSLIKSRQNNGVHPASEGYMQIADGMWAFLKSDF